MKLSDIKQKHFICIFFVLLLILPVTYSFLSALFGNSVQLEPDTILEELAKSFISIILTILGVVVSNLITERRISKNIDFLTEEINEFLSVRKSLMENLIGSLEKFLGLINNGKKFNVVGEKAILLEEIKSITKELLNDFEGEFEIIFGSELEVIHGCKKYRTIIQKAIVKMRCFLREKDEDSGRNLIFALKALSSLLIK